MLAALDFHYNEKSKQEFEKPFHCSDIELSGLSPVYMH